MKNLYILLITAIFLLSCSDASTEIKGRTTIINTQIIQPTITQQSDPTPIKTQEQTVTFTVTPTKVKPPTVTSLPTMTKTPTVDMPNYYVADCIPKNTLVQKGKVIEIIDGDTITVLLEDGNSKRIRYNGLNTPEQDRPYFAEATQANYGLTYMKDAVLISDVTDVDQYDRLIRYVVVGDIFVNLELVRLGFAFAETYPPDVACENTFLSTQDEARESGRGLWEATPTPEPEAPKIVVVTVNKREEWVDIQNTGTMDIDLAGWNLVSERGNQDCPLSGIIIAGQTLRIWAMTPQGLGFSCGYNTNIWNNSELDPAVLYNPKGVEVSRK